MGGGYREGVTPDGLTMTTSSNLRVAPCSAIASGHMGRWEEWEECRVQRLRRQEGVRNGGTGTEQRKCKDTGFPP